MNFSKIVNENIEKKENDNVGKKNITYTDLCTKINDIFDDQDTQIKEVIVEKNQNQEK